MRGIIFRTCIIAAGLWLADALIDGVEIANPVTLLLSAMVLGLINAVLRPILVILTLPISVVTLGLFILMINAGLFGLAAAFIDGFRVGGFGSALAGTLVVSFVSWVASSFIGPKGRYQVLVIRRQ